MRSIATSAHEAHLIFIFTHHRATVRHPVRVFHPTAPAQRGWCATARRPPASPPGISSARTQPGNMVPTPPNSTLSSSHAATRMATLHNGVLMPMVGFGCAGYVRKPALLDALSVGYRLFDTAQAHEWYLEEEVGDAMEQLGGMAGACGTLDSCCAL